MPLVWVIIVVGLGYVVINAKSNALVSGSTSSSSSFVVPNSTSSSSWPYNLSITAIRLNGSNYAQWTKSVEIYFIIKKQYKCLVDNPPIARRLVRRSMRIGKLTMHIFASFCGTV